MKKLFLAMATFCFATTSLRADCDTPALYVTLYAGGPVVNLSTFSGSVALYFYLDVLPDSWAPDCNASSVTMDITLRLKQGATVYSTQSYTGMTCSSYQTAIQCDAGPCAYGPSYKFNNQPQALLFYISAQSCGQYTVDAEVSNISTSGNVPSTRTIRASNLGNTTTTCNLSGSGSCSLGSLTYVNFAGTSGLTASMSTTASTCGQSNGTATITPGGGSTPYTYAWLGSMSTGSTATGLAPGTYTATVTDANGCAYGGVAYVQGALSVSISPGSQTVCEDKCFTLTTSVTPAGSYTYTWFHSINGGAQTQIGTGSSICVRAISTSSVSTTANAFIVQVNGGGCSGSATVTMTVDPDCTEDYYNGCCTNPDARVAAPGESPENASLTIAPNPATRETNIVFGLPAGNGRIEIYSIDGRLVQRIDDIHDSGTVKLMTGGFAAGIYNVILLSGDTRMRTEKLVITE